jgi:hypothetical protein
MPLHPAATASCARSRTGTELGCALTRRKNNSKRDICLASHCHSPSAAMLIKAYGHKLRLPQPLAPAVAPAVKSTHDLSRSFGKRVMAVAWWLFPVPSRSPRQPRRFFSPLAP